MSNLRQAAQSFVDCWDSGHFFTDRHAERIRALRAALAEPEQEPVGYANERDLEQMRRHGGGSLLWGRDQLDDLSGYTPLYTAPPQRKPLTDEEALELWNKHEKHWRFENNALAFTRAIEAAHGIKEKNT